MFEVLVFLFENYYDADQYPDHDTLQKKLSAAGFENEDIHSALDWLKGLNPDDGALSHAAIDASLAQRVYAPREIERVPAEGRGFIAFLESAGIITPTLREVIIDRALALGGGPVGIDRLKVIILMVLWTRRGSVDALVLDELLPDGEKRQMH